MPTSLTDPSKLMIPDPPHSSWIAGMTRPGVTAYLQTMFVQPGELR
jgi:hypothetical protein